MFVSCECCVLLGRGLCDKLITRPEESYRLWCVVVCDLETSWMRRPWLAGGCRAKKKKLSLMHGANMKIVLQIMRLVIVYNKLKNPVKITLNRNLSVITEGRTIAFF